eukprot:72487-Rhodomonas_salina.7
METTTHLQLPPSCHVLRSVREAGMVERAFDECADDSGAVTTLQRSKSELPLEFHAIFAIDTVVQVVAHKHSLTFGFDGPRPSGFVGTGPGGGR